MKIFDCFMYFDEEIVLDLRLNALNDYIDYFVIVESCYTHKGDKRKLTFNHKKFEQFKDKIIYLVYEDEPKELLKINDPKEDDHEYVFNALCRENGQRNFISEGLTFAKDNDFILISDVDEIPNLEEINFSEIKEKIVQFKQDMFYYKFNLRLPSLTWVGTKACKKKDLISPQWIRNVKDKKYSPFRLDILFSKTKYSDIKFIQNGGWHFTNIKNASDIELKFKSYLHHREFDANPLSIDQINDLIKNKKAIYDLKVDKRAKKIGDGGKLETYSISKLPKYLQENLKKYNNWID